MFRVCESSRFVATPQRDYSWLTAHSKSCSMLAPVFARPVSSIGCMDSSVALLVNVEKHDLIQMTDLTSHFVLLLHNSFIAND